MGIYHLNSSFVCLFHTNSLLSPTLLKICRGRGIANIRRRTYMVMFGLEHSLVSFSHTQLLVEFHSGFGD
ncbi:hypothetical protein HPP92_017045 [Vanilla planifolia]|uniref:Uncharacterized protein n=1 Tax=Vanilla planifolia TaxID=51239 RepID=A0A835QML2_VANPL|nr:hypothetical protein HPP92_017045 [Vanilla planifolia]